MAHRHVPLRLTTNLFSGLIREQYWYGSEGMEHLRTVKEPKQSIPTFAETVELLMKVIRTLVFGTADVADPLPSLRTATSSSTST